LPEDSTLNSLHAILSQWFENLLSNQAWASLIQAPCRLFTHVWPNVRWWWCSQNMISQWFWTGFWTPINLAHTFP